MNCTCMSEDNEFVIGRDEAVYFYEPEGRGQCVVFEGVKKQLYWFREYLVKKKNFCLFVFIFSQYLNS